MAERDEIIKPDDRWPRIDVPELFEYFAECRFTESGWARSEKVALALLKMPRMPPIPMPRTDSAENA